LSKFRIAQRSGAAEIRPRIPTSALDQGSLYYAGRILPHLGAFIQLTYDGVQKQGHIDNIDVRYAKDTDLLNQDLVYGFTANNSPTISDLWNCTPVWGFPYNSSKLAPTPMAAALVDGKLEQRVAGVGAYAMWNDLLYLEFDAYRGLGYDVLNATGIVPVANTDKSTGLIPYWRAALQKNADRSYFQLGTYGLSADIRPGGIETPGLTNRLTDVAFDTNYQFVFNPRNVVSDMISALATVIHEDSSLLASRPLSGTNSKNSLETFRTDISYSFGATITSTVQYFQTHGSSDAAYWGTATSRPNSAGFIAEIAYVPFGKPDSLIAWGNIRFAVQYIDYIQFNGTSSHASDNNALYLSVWAAMHF